MSRSIENLVNYRATQLRADALDMIQRVWNVGSLALGPGDNQASDFSITAGSACVKVVRHGEDYIDRADEDSQKRKSSVLNESPEAPMTKNKARKRS
jgi:hypothetical protein